ncbi:hypothetical protein ACHAXR_002728, partial [Thalassiosira sp. AJA248-18]
MPSEPSTTPTSTSAEGTCPLHPVIQLQRRQRRTGEWKVILNNCPLCASGLPAMSSPGNGSDGGGGMGVGSDGGIGGSGVGSGGGDAEPTTDDSGDDEQSIRSQRSSMSYNPILRSSLTTSPSSSSRNHHRSSS